MTHMSDDKCRRHPVDRHVREAARWLVTLQHPNLSPRLWLRWKKWQESPRNREAFDSLQPLWRAIHSSAGELRREKTNNKSPSSWRLAAAAATVTLSFLLAFVVWSSWSERSFTTGPGQWRSMTLADGTVLHIGPRTTLKVDFDDARRIARLSQGEAVFEVAKDPMRPFTVSTHLIDVTAIGTRFGVSIESGVTTTVSKGTVKITAHGNDDDGKAAVMLNAGEQLSVSGRGLDERTYAKVDAERKLEWANGWLEFEGETIGQAAKEFNRRNVVQIEIEQPEISARRLQGFYRFPVDSSATFARHIANENGLALIEDPSGQVIRLRRPEAQL
jgi:transmembrane sensor